MKFNTVDTRYYPGDRFISQKHKSGEKRHHSKSGTFVEPIGFGNAVESTPSEYYLIVEAGKGQVYIRIDSYFKERRKKLTEKRRAKLRAAMPEEVQLVKRKTSGREIITVSDQDMAQWCEAAGIR